MRILLVDDEPLLIRALKRLLHSVGYSDVTSASTAVEALELARNNDFDVALIDLVLPRHDGYWLVEQLAAHPGTARIRCVLMTGSYVHCTVDGLPLLQKPFSSDELVEALEGR